MRTTRFFLTAAAFAAAVPAQATWTQITTASQPSLRRAGAMAFDSVGAVHRVLLFGGVSPGPGTILAETWTFNGTWTQQSSTGAPARWGHAMVRDDATSRILAFGGRSPTLSGLANDTWAWNGTAWSAVPTPTAPPARYLHGMSYDSVRNRIVVFGGRGAFQTLADTWEFDGVAWQQITTAHTPPAREEMVMHYVPGLRRTVLFGGYDRDAEILRGDTWEYDGVDWQQVAPAASPSARYRAASAYDSVRQRIVLYGGYDGTAVVTDTHEYLGDTWQLISVGPGSTSATEMYTAYDAQRRKLVTFGGVGETFSNQTWEYTGASTAFFSTFGQGCATSTGVADVVCTSLPVLGSNLAVDFTGLPTSTAATIVVVGTSNTLFGGVLPLPLDLSIIGLTGCNLLVSGELVTIAPAAGGVSSFTLAIPNNVSLLNAVLYTQALIPDPLAPNANGGTSRGGRAVLGN